MRKIIDFFRKVDTFVEQKSQKVHFVVYDLVVIFLALIFATFGLVMMLVCSFQCGLTIFALTNIISSYLLYKRHKKHIDRWMN